jgi:hypothetical protein
MSGRARPRDIDENGYAVVDENGYAVGLGRLRDGGRPGGKPIHQSMSSVVG